MNDCTHENIELRHRDTNNSYCMQCLECGRTFGSIKHNDLTDEQKADAPALDDSIQERHWAAKREASTVARQEQKQEWFKKHNNYLMSYEWRAKRIEVLRRDGYMCQACLKNQASEVHHLRYDHWGNEPLFDLVSVCKPCHEDITLMDRRRRGEIVDDLQY